MIRYIVKKKIVGSRYNTNFAGETSITYHGKEDKLIAFEGTHYGGYESPLARNRYMIAEYGYETRQAAKRNYTYRHPEVEDIRFWDVEQVSIIKVELKDCHSDHAAWREECFKAIDEWYKEAVSMGQEAEQ